MEELYSVYLSSTGICTDTRNITNGCLFVALKGERFDANEMVADALKGGASHVITSNTAFKDNKQCTVVPDTLVALQELATFHRKHLHIPVIGITGTNGKTTTKELTAAVLSKKYRVLSTKGNLNNHIGVPLTLLSINENLHDIAVVEMGASHPGEIKQLSSFVMPDSGLITNVGIAHTEGFGSFEGVKATKRELYEQLKSTSGKVFININNPNLVEMLGNYNNAVQYTSGSQSAFISGKVLGPSELLSFSWSHNGVSYNVNTNLTGAYNLENALAAATVGTFYNVPANDICAAISEYIPTNGRSQIIQTERNRVIMDAYNANPTSMMASVNNFASLKGDNKVVILGAMRELGNIEYEMHHKLLSALVEHNISKAYLVGPEFAQLKSSFPSFSYVNDASELTDSLSSLSDAYILVKGSHSNRLDKLKDIL
ncbi:MAG: UDP-N-acetylmuramoyl-tripeptide--D-alanyl-D-alanine ligase [Bacteroidia bacterium]|nr:UDP-N-acetylmuramoyl-tripeptide--D-alanyl-D-alanine ligase [Bacteroidia bacterium]